MGTILSHLQTSSITRFHIAEKKSIFIELCVFRNEIFDAIFTRITWVEACLCVIQIRGPMALCRGGAGTSPAELHKELAQTQVDHSKRGKPILTHLENGCSYIPVFFRISSLLTHKLVIHQSISHQLLMDFSLPFGSKLMKLRCWIYFCIKLMKLRCWIHFEPNS